LNSSLSLTFCSPPDFHPFRLFAPSRTIPPPSRASPVSCFRHWHRPPFFIVPVLSHIDESRPRRFDPSFIRFHHRRRRRWEIPNRSVQIFSAGLLQFWPFGPFPPLFSSTRGGCRIYGAFFLAPVPTSVELPPIGLHVGHARDHHLSFRDEGGPSFL